MRYTESKKIEVAKLLLLRCRHFRDENARRITMKTSVCIVQSTADTTTGAHAESYNDVSRWNIFTISHHLPGSVGIVWNALFKDYQVDVRRSAALSTVETENHLEQHQLLLEQWTLLTPE